MPRIVIKGAIKRLASVRNCQGQYSCTGTPSVATMNKAVACHGIMLSIIVPVSSMDRESTFLGTFKLS